jgi:hypothetical protein
VSRSLEAQHLLQLSRCGGVLRVVVAAEVDAPDEDVGHLLRVGVGMGVRTGL